MTNDLDHIIQGCIKNDPQAQSQLYEMYSPILYALCLRYLKRVDSAEDVLIESFYKILTRIHTYQNHGSFEGWMKRITINEALMELRKNHALKLFVELDPGIEKSNTDNILSQLQFDELIHLIEALPDGYRTIFNLYVIEGFKHREIAEMLNISIHTSKSQLILAKRRLREAIEKKINKVKHF